MTRSLIRRLTCGALVLLSILNLDLLADLGLDTSRAHAKRLTSRQLRGYVKESRRIQRNFRRAAQRLLRSGKPLTDGMKTRGYEVKVKGGLAFLYKAGTRDQPNASCAVIDGNKVAVVHTSHERRDRGRVTRVRISLSPGKTLNASSLGANARNSILVAETGRRSNGDTPGTRSFYRSYDWNGKQIAAVSTTVYESDGNLERRTSGGRVVDTRREQRVNSMSYLSYPLGKPKGTHPNDRAGQYRFGENKHGEFQWVKVK